MVVTQLQELGKTCIIRLFLLLCQSLFCSFSLLSLLFCTLFCSFSLLSVLFCALFSGTCALFSGTCTLFCSFSLLSLLFCALFSGSKFALQGLNLVILLMRHLMRELSGSTRTGTAAVNCQS